MPDVKECDIVSYFHCKKCLVELPKGVSPAEWSSQDVGWTEYGIQVWCNRHNENIVGVDFNKVAELYNSKKKEE